MAIKNIILDFGGVLLNIDYQLTLDAFVKLGVPAFKEMYNQYSADELFSNLETGHAKHEDFPALLCKRANVNLAEEDVLTAWNAMLLDYRTNSFKYLETIKDDFNLYLLSNTNFIHKSAFDKAFREQTGYESINNFFKKAYYSHEIGLRKPNADIYEFVLNDEGMDREETLFIDDSFNNIEAASKLGIKCHLLKPEERIENVIPYLTSSNSI